MARGRRRSTRANNLELSEFVGEDAASPPQAPGSQDSNGSQPTPQEEDRCPACADEAMQGWNAADKESWVRCDACKSWFHWRCAGDGDLEAVDKWCVCNPSCYDCIPELLCFLCTDEGFANVVLKQT